jgi:molecular chaperone HscB
MADCWTCGAERGRAAFCPSCKKIQPVITNTSYFESLGLEPIMGLKRAILEKAYRQQAQRVHPDRFGQTTRMERRLALEQTTHLNDAYQTLKKPRPRADYLMKRAGHKVGTEDQRVDDMDFLIEMMTLRESLEGAESLAQIEPLRDQIENRFDSHIETLKQYFDNNQGSETAALKASEELRFLERFLDEVENKFDE